MKISVFYNVRDTYCVPDEKWREAMASCDDDPDDAFDLLMEEGMDDYDLRSDVTDRYVEAGKK
jgi:hypothetical protein